MQGNIKTVELFRGTGGAITKNAYLDTDPIDLRNLRSPTTQSKGQLHIVSVGGTITVTTLVASYEDGTFVAPTTAVTWLTTAAEGTTVSAAVNIPIFPWIKLRFTETNVAAVSSLDAWLHFR